MKAEEVLTVSVEAQGPVRVVRVAGELDMATVSDVEASFETRLAAETDLVIDLSELSFMDSAGVAALVRVRNAALEQGWVLRVRGASGIVANVLRVTGIDAILTMEA